MLPIDELFPGDFSTIDIQKGKGTKYTGRTGSCVNHVPLIIISFSTRRTSAEKKKKKKIRLNTSSLN